VKEVAGALKYTRYGWLKRRVMRYIAGKAGGSTDTSRDHEYTDWEDLRVFAESLATEPAKSAAGIPTPPNMAMSKPLTTTATGLGPAVTALKGIIT
jgi:hypothetical protein